MENIRTLINYLFIFILIANISGCKFFDKILDGDKLEIDGDKKLASNKIYTSRISIADNQVSNRTTLSANPKIAHQSEDRYAKLQSNINGSGNVSYNWPKEATWSVDVKNKNGKNNEPKSLRNKTNSIATSYNFSMSSNAILTSQSSMVVLDRKGVLRAFSLDEGKLLWKVSTPKAPKTNLFNLLDEPNFFFSGGMVNDGDVVYLTDGSEFVSAFNITNGTKVWSTNLDSISRGIPLVVNELVLVQTANNSVYALDKNNGSLKWLKPGVSEDDDVSSFTSNNLAKINNDIVAMQSNNHSIALINAKDGSVVGNISYSVYDTYIKTEETVLANAPIFDHSSGILFALTEDGTILALDCKNYRKLWSNYFNVRKPFWISGDYIFAVNDGGQLLAIDKKTGGLYWVKDMAESKSSVIAHEINPYDAYSAPIVMGDVVTVVRYDGVLLGYDPKTGELIKQLRIDNRSTLPIILHNNIFYVLSRSGIITEYFN